MRRIRNGIGKWTLGVETLYCGEMVGIFPTAENSMDAKIPAAYGETLLGQFDQRFLNKPYVNTALLALIAGILSVAAVQATVQIRKVDKSPYRASGERHKTALGRWMPDAQALTAGEDPYGTGHWFPTPPLVLMSLVPLSKMPFVAAGAVWAFSKVVGVVLVILLLHRTLLRGGVAIPSGVWIMAGAFGLRALYSEMTHANVNTYMMIWLALTWVFFLNRRDFWAGIFLALAVVTKITPALLVVYFLYKRAWKVCLGAGAGLLLFFFILPGLYLGFGRNWELLQSWYHMLVAPFAREGYAALENENQSLYGVCVRLLSNCGWMKVSHMPDEQAWSVGMESMARPATALGALLRPAISLSIVLALAWLCRAKIVRRCDPRLFLEYGLVLVAMLLLSERTWKHHATTLILSYLGVWYALTCLTWSDKFRAWFVGGLGVQFLLLVALSEGLIGDDLADRVMEGGLFCWGLVLFFIQTGILIHTLAARDRSGPAASGPTIAQAA